MDIFNAIVSTVSTPVVQLLSLLDDNSTFGKIKAIRLCNIVLKDEEYQQLLETKANLYSGMLNLNSYCHPLLCKWIHESSFCWKMNVIPYTDNIIINKINEKNITILKLIYELYRQYNDIDIEALYTSLPLNNNNLQEELFYKWYIEHNIKLFCVADHSKSSGYPLFSDKHKSGMSLVLKNIPYLYELYQKQETSTSYTFEKLIQCGIDIPSITVGCAAGDDETYHKFKNFFIALIVQMNLINPENIIKGNNWVGHNGKYDLNCRHIINPGSFDTKYILASWIKGTRNIASIPFPAHCNRLERRFVELIISNALKLLPKSLDGIYVSIGSMTKDDEKLLLDNRIAFPKPPPNCMLSASGGTNDWPLGRGVFLDSNKPYLMWINNEDHIRIDVKDSTGDLYNLFQTYCTFMNELETILLHDGHKFMKDSMFGYHATCPSNSGCGMHIGTFLKLPLLIKKGEEKLVALCSRLGLNCQIRKVQNVDICELSNMFMYGYSEVEIVQTMINGISILIDLEKCLESKDKPTFMQYIKDVPLVFTGPCIPADTFIPTTNNDYIISTKVDHRDDEMPLYTDQHKSLVAKYLNDTIFFNILNKRYPKNSLSTKYTLSDAFRVSWEIPDTKVGLHLGTEDCLEHFRPLLLPILRDLHGFDLSKQLQVNDLDVNCIVGWEKIDQEYIISGSMTTSRNIKGFPMMTAIDRENRRKIENILKLVLCKLSSQFNNSPLYGGVYHSIAEESMDNFKDNKRISSLIECPLPGSKADIAGITRDWPDARGIYTNEIEISKNIIIGINLEDHFKILCTTVDDDKSITTTTTSTTTTESNETIDSGVSNNKLLNMFQLWNSTMGSIESLLQITGYRIMQNAHFGYITSCPSILGTGLLIEIIIKLEYLSKSSKLILKTCSREHILVTEAFEIGEYYWKLSNKDYLGRSERQILQNMIDCIGALIILDKDLMIQTLYPNGIPVEEDENHKSNTVTPETIISNAVATSKSSETVCVLDELYKSKFVVDIKTINSNVTRNAYPPGSLSKYMTLYKLDYGSPFEGEWLNKKMGKEKIYQKRYLWIDPLTFSFHWSKSDNKILEHKCISFCYIRTIKQNEFAKANNDELPLTIMLKSNENINIILPSNIKQEIKLDWMKVFVEFINNTRQEDDE